ncbi:MAG: hypothetical protein ACK5MW_05815 [Enterococcus sp.]
MENNKRKFALHLSQLLPWLLMIGLTLSLLITPLAITLQNTALNGEFVEHKLTNDENLSQIHAIILDELDEQLPDLNQVDRLTKKVITKKKTELVIHWGIAAAYHGKSDFDFSKLTPNLNDLAGNNNLVALLLGMVLPTINDYLSEQLTQAVEQIHEPVVQIKQYLTWISWIGSCFILGIAGYFYFLTRQWNKWFTRLSWASLIAGISGSVLLFFGQLIAFHQLSLASNIETLLQHVLTSITTPLYLTFGLFILLAGGYLYYQKYGLLKKVPSQK